MVLAHLKNLSLNKTFLQPNFFAAQVLERVICTSSPQFHSLYLSYTHSSQAFDIPHPTEIALIRVSDTLRLLSPILGPHLT